MCLLGYKIMGYEIVGYKIIATYWLRFDVFIRSQRFCGVFIGQQTTATNTVCPSCCDTRVDTSIDNYCAATLILRNSALSRHSPLHSCVHNGVGRADSRAITGEKVSIGTFHNSHVLHSARHIVHTLLSFTIPRLLLFSQICFSEQQSVLF